MNADGTNPVRLTFNSSHDGEPTWSPNGTKIAFDSNRDGIENTEIYVMNADGSNQTRLTTTITNIHDQDPVWSPDGTKIAYSSNPDRDDNSEIYVMNADGSNPIRLTNNVAPDGRPAWSPDGTKIAFDSKRDGNYEIYAMNADGSNQTRLTTNLGNGFNPNLGIDIDPTWSPDGTKIAFLSYRDENEIIGQIYLMNPDGSNQTQLTSNEFSVGNLSWSPVLGPIITVSISSLNLGTIPVGASVSGSITISNVGNSTLSVSSTAIDGPDSSHFFVLPNQFSVASGDSQTVQVTFHPSTPGLKTATLVLTHNGSESPVQIPLTGTGLLPVTLILGHALGAIGKSVSVPITLTNSNGTPTGGFQWQVIRSSASVQFDSLVTSIPDFTANANTIGDTTFVVLHSPGGAVIAPGTTTLGFLRYRIDADAPLCTPIPLTIQALEISDSLGVALPDSSINGEIQAGIRGDLNLDCQVSILDIIQLVRILVGKTAAPDTASCAFFIADENADKTLDILDVIGQVNTILHLSKVIASGPVSPACVSLGAVQPGGSGGYRIPIEVQADGRIAGLQATIQFDPAAVTVGTPQLAGPAVGLSVDAAVQGGTLRFVLYDPRPGAGIAPWTGLVALIPVTLREGHTGTPMLTLTDVMLASPQAQRVPVTIGASSVKIGALPTAFALRGNRPNPFNPSTEIAYDVPQLAHITLTVYNMLGQEVVRLVDTVQVPGQYRVLWHGRNAAGQAVASGVYLYRLTSSTGFSQTRRMTVLK